MIGVMKKIMSKNEALAFKKKWQNVHNFEAKELRQMSFEQKLTQLLSLLALDLPSQSKRAVLPAKNWRQLQIMSLYGTKK